MTEQMSNGEIIAYYKSDLERLARYIPWLQKIEGTAVSQSYGDNGVADHSMKFPVYDSTLLSFVREADKSCFMNRNYPYIYSWNKLNGMESELTLIENATIRDMEKLGGILSRYILGGRTKAKLWSDGATYGIYLAILEKALELVAFWEGQPME